MSVRLKFVNKLKNEYPHYDLSTSITSKRPTNATQTEFLYEACAKVTIFSFTEDQGKKHAYTEKIVSGLGEGKSAGLAEESAIVRALEHLGFGYEE